MLKVVLLLLLALLTYSPELRAQMPFYTDDTGITEPRKFHVEAFEELDGLQSSRYPDLRQSTTNIKFNFSPMHRVELDFDLPYIKIARAAGTAGASGIGDADAGVKWNFRETSPDSNRTALAASLYIEFPTGDTQQGLGSGLTDYALNFIAEKPLSATTRVNLNVGILFAGNTSTGAVGIQTHRGQVYTGGLSLTHDLNTRLTLGAEVYGGISDGAGSDRSQLQGLLGAQFAIKQGCSVSFAVLGGKYGATPSVGGQLGVALDFPDVLHHSL
jgi:hypothetical protein